MQILPFSPIGGSYTIAATTANTTQVMPAPTSPTLPCNLRVVNDGADDALIAMGDSTVDATTDPQVIAVPVGERVLSWKPGATYVGVALRSGAGSVQVQLGAGV